MSYDRRAWKRPNPETRKLMNETAKLAKHAAETAAGVQTAAQGIESMLEGAMALEEGEDFHKLADLHSHLKKGIDYLSRIKGTLDGNVKALLNPSK